MIEIIFLKIIKEANFNTQFFICYFSSIKAKIIFFCFTEKLTKLFRQRCILKYFQSLIFYGRQDDPLVMSISKLDQKTRRGPVLVFLSTTLWTYSSIQFERSKSNGHSNTTKKAITVLQNMGLSRETHLQLIEQKKEFMCSIEFWRKQIGNNFIVLRLIQVFF